VLLPEAILLTDELPAITTVELAVT